MPCARTGVARAASSASARWLNPAAVGTLDIVATHGKAGGKLVGTAYNQVSDLRNIFPSADIYLMGHDHKRGCLPDSHLHVPHTRAGGMIVKQRRQWMGRTGSYLKGYVEGEDAYIVRRLLKPCELGYIKFEVKARRMETRDRDITTIDINGWA